MISTVQIEDTIKDLEKVNTTESVFYITILKLTRQCSGVVKFYNQSSKLSIIVEMLEHSNHPLKGICNYYINEVIKSNGSHWDGKSVISPSSTLGEIKFYGESQQSKVIRPDPDLLLVKHTLSINEPRFDQNGMFI